MPFPVDSEAAQVEEEARSIVGTLIAQVMGIIRAIINMALSTIRQLVQWAGEHPLALVLGVANLVIWIT